MSKKKILSVTGIRSEYDILYSVYNAIENHPNLEKLYLPDGYEGNPMLKSFELISREVKPWPGDVDVEGMPEESESDETPDD